MKAFYVRELPPRCFKSRSNLLYHGETHLWNFPLSYYSPFHCNRRSSKFCAQETQFELSLFVFSPWRRMAQQSCGDTDCDDGPWLRLHLYVSWVDHGCEPHHQCRFGLDGRPAGQHGQVLVSGSRLLSHDLFISDTWLPPG